MGRNARKKAIQKNSGTTYHPINLALRFLLELTALVGFGLFGWSLSDTFWFSLIGAAILPVLAMTFWGVFAVPNDKSRSGKAPIPVSGLVRFILELVFFGLAVWCYMLTQHLVFGALFSGFLVLHYALSMERIKWLFVQKGKERT